MTDFPRERARLDQEQLGAAFRDLCREHEASLRPLDESTWAKIEARRQPDVTGANLRALPAPEGRRPRAVVFVVAAACGLLALGSLTLLESAPEELTFEVTGSGGKELRTATLEADSKQLIASEEAPVIVTFSDQTKLTLRPHSTVRLEASGQGASKRILAALSQGELELSGGEIGTPEAGEENGAPEVQVRAGTFKLKAMGASFVFGYTPSEQRMHLQTKSGSVLVTEQSGKTHHVGAKESLMLTAKRTPTEVGIASSSAEAVSAAPASEVKSSRKGPSQDVKFHELAAEGKFSEIVSRARAQGIDALLQSGSASDLQEVAQAARYTGQLALSEQIWNRMATRFSGSAVASNAHFFLGRLAEQKGNPSVALRQYEAYLSSTGDGVYTSAALGRKLSLVHQSQGVQKARPVASEYLRRYPEGPYAKQARELLGAD